MSNVGKKANNPKKEHKVCLDVFPLNFIERFVDSARNFYYGN